ncbi:Electron transport complex protein RnfE [Candidatus Enterovibrio escicola]|uniref:Ion-translocating oxidoreductase complex subunit E n=1 Tax=Candidatus Enterovibrio escicola TaxID=1927127 RepID=A0A2A5T340_9GAMM|nr:Electron transport complex protein RnfE [Candidatus Enterovibrio escacola]
MSLNTRLMKNGLWNNNPVLVQILGICPLLAVSATLTNALGLGLASTLVVMTSNFVISLIRQWIPKEVRIPIFVMIIASLVTCIQLLMNAHAYGLYQSLGIFIPLIVTNCTIIGRAEVYASKNNPLSSVLDGFWMGMGMTASLVILGTIREILGSGTLFEGADRLLGEWAVGLRIQIFHLDNPFLLVILPPGAFLTVGLLIALRNVFDNQQTRK